MIIFLRKLAINKKNLNKVDINEKLCYTLFRKVR